MADDPDIKQVVDELKKAWMKMMDPPKRAGGSGGGNGAIPMRPRGGGGGGGNLPKMILTGIILLFVVVGVWTSFYTVDVNQEAVVVRFGKYVQTTGPGLNFKIPYGVDDIYKVASKTTLQEEFGFRTRGEENGRSKYATAEYRKESLMLTGDLNVADVEWAVQYKISDPWKFLFHAKDVRRNIRDVSMSIMRRVVGDRLADDVLTTGRVAIASEAKVLIQEVMDKYDVGIAIEQVILQDVNPPDPVKPAFNEVNAAKQEQEQAINNAEREYNRVIPEAKGKGEKLIAGAEGYAIQAINRAKGDTAAFRALSLEYRKAPKVTRSRLYIETLEKVLSESRSLTVVDKDLKGILPVYRPMNSLDAAAAASSSAGEK